MDYWELGDWEQSREYWNQLGKQLGIARRQITDAEVAKIRERLPYGPPNPAWVPELALDLQIFPISIFRLWVGATFKRRNAFPKDHPVRLNLNADNAEKQRERDKINRIDIASIGESQGWLCVYCSVKLTGKLSPHTDGKQYHRDHIIPLHHGGQTVFENIQLVCAKCNHRKRTMPDEVFQEVLPRMERAEREREEWRRFAECPCLYWGCPPGCVGCETCVESNDADEGVHPFRIICPVVGELRSEFGWDWDECSSPDACRSEQQCRQIVRVRQ